MKIKIAIAGFLLLLVAFALYIKDAVSKFEYKLEVLSYTVVKIDLDQEAIINVILKITLMNSLFFSLPVNLLYYEIYFRDNLLGKSSGATTFKINASPEPTIITESIDLFIDKTNIEVASNFLLKRPTEFTVKVVTRVFGITINLKNIKLIQ